MIRRVFVVTATLAVALAAGTALPAAAAPLQLAVPALVQFCVRSNPFPGSDYATPEVRTAIFDGLFERLKQSAWTAGATSIGVPFVDEVVRTPPPGASTTADDEARAVYVVRECAVVSTQGADFPASGIVQVPAHAAVAVLCGSASFEACRQEVESGLKSAVSPPHEGAKVVVRTRQALSADGTAAGLIAALTDSSLIVLRDAEGTTQAGRPTASPGTFPEDLAVVSAEFGD